MTYNIGAGSNTLYTYETELTFKRYIDVVRHRAANWRFFFLGVKYNEFVYIF